MPSKGIELKTSVLSSICWACYLVEEQAVAVNLSCLNVCLLLPAVSFHLTDDIFPEDES